MGSKSQNLLREVDALIARHGADNPELRTDLETLREKLVDALRRQHAEDVARIGLQILDWVRWIWENLPPLN